ncbi:MAG: polysaccharide deacetylase family protein [Firmicutes bacterium]|nr:polysaccharide deacetylase family protein [Bacillota bacterium]
MKQIYGRLKRKLMFFLIMCITVGSMTAGHIFLDSGKMTGGGPEHLEEHRENSVFLPIIMYHSIVEKGSTGDYVISEDTLEKDLKWLKDKGYETVFVEDVIAYAEGSGKLPSKPVMITFDDGMKNNMSTAYKVMEKYEAKGVYSVVGSYCDRGYPYMDWNELAEFAQYPFVEIQNHSYDFHELGDRRGSMRMQGEGFCEYITKFASDTSKMQMLLKEKAGVEAVCYTYPFGLISSETYPVIEDLGFKASLTCIEKSNMINQGEESCLYRLNRYNRSSSESTDSFMDRITSE